MSNKITQRINSKLYYSGNSKSKKQQTQIRRGGVNFR